MGSKGYSPKRDPNLKELGQVELTQRIAIERFMLRLKSLDGVHVMEKAYSRIDVLCREMVTTVFQAVLDEMLTKYGGKKCNTSPNE